MPRTTRRGLTMALGAALMASLFGSTATAVENQLPTGFHDTVADPYARRGECVAAGWAVDPDSPYSRVMVRISVDGAELTTVAADQYRQDLLDAGVSPDGYSSFYVFMGPLGITFDTTHSIFVEAQDVQTLEWTPLASTPQTLTCTNLIAWHDGSSGTVGRADCVAAGWAVDFDTPSGPRVEVRVRVDGKVVTAVSANQFRQDILDVFGVGDGYWGFSVNLFGRMTPGVQHSVTVEARDSTLKRVWLPAFETPRTMTCMPG